MFNLFDYEEDDRALAALLAVAGALAQASAVMADPAAIEKFLKAGAEFRAAKLAAEEAIAKVDAAKVAAEEAISERRRVEAETRDWHEREDRQLRQRRADIDQNEQIVRDRLSAVADRERVVTEREQAHERELARLREHVGNRAA